LNQKKIAYQHVGPQNSWVSVHPNCPNTAKSGVINLPNVVTLGGAYYGRSLRLGGDVANGKSELWME